MQSKVFDIGTPSDQELPLAHLDSLDHLFMGAGGSSEEDDEDDEDEGRDNNPGVTYLRSFKSAAKLS